MKYALIGCGRISELHLRAAAENGLEISALCDILPEAAEGKKLSHGLENAVIYTDYRELLEKEKPDLVAVTTDSGAHAEIAIACIKAGCHVIIEKPMAMSMADAREIVRLSREMDVRVCACHQNRFNKSIRRMRKAIESGRFGKLLHGNAYVRWHRGDDYYELADWRGTWEGDGGTLMNQCIHDIDLLRWMMGPEVTEVFGYTDRLNHDIIEAEDFGCAVVKFANGSYGIIEGTTNVFDDDLEEKLVVFGSKGTAKAGGISCNALEEWRFADCADDADCIKAKSSEEVDNVYGFGHGAVYADVIAAINEHRDPYITAEDGMNALEMVLAIYLSASEGRPVKLPLGNVASTDFKGRFGV